MGETTWKFKIKRKKSVNVSGSTADEQTFAFLLSLHVWTHTTFRFKNSYLFHTHRPTELHLHKTRS